MVKDVLKRLFYRNKTTLSFKKYVTNTKQTFNVIENYNVPLYEEDKVRQLLDNINTPNNDLKAEVNIFRSSHIAIFEIESKYLPAVISRPLPENHTSSGRFGRIRNAKSNGRGGGGGRCGRFECREGCGRVGQGGSREKGKGTGNQIENAVDISNLTMWYGKE